MNSDNRIHLTRKKDSEGIWGYWFSCATEDRDLFEKAQTAIKQYGTRISVLTGFLSDYHQQQGYRNFMLWAILTDKTDINAFLSAIYS